MVGRTASLFLDRAAISLSLLCIVHCLALPVLLVLMPTLATLSIADEHFHVVLLFLILPTSFAALFMGYRRHRRLAAMTWGLAGVGVLLGAALFGHDVLGGAGEKALTVVGSLLVTVGHVLNFRRCRSWALSD